MTDLGLTCSDCLGCVMADVVAIKRKGDKKQYVLRAASENHNILENIHRCLNRYGMKPSEPRESLSYHDKTKRGL